MADHAAPGERLLAQAERLELGQHPEWLDLLHYEQSWPLLPARSATRYSGFFVHPEGWRDPQGELRATLQAILAPEEEGGYGADRDQHAQCAFPARTDWLVRQLDIPAERLPRPDCSRFREWVEGVNAGNVTLVYSDAYLNNPASAFGHTLLRLDPPGERGSTPLISYAVNHAAATGDSAGMMYAARGMAGGFPGYYALLPYYEKVREYNDMEDRDLWEYQLNLEPHEVDQLMRHLWEVGHVPFPYYFFNRNCSYRLLTALEVARPGSDLARGFRFRAIPVDTIRAVLEQDGLLEDVVWRPAAATRLQATIDALTPQQRRDALAIARDERAADVSERPPEARAAILEAAYDYLHYRHQAGATDPEDAARLRELLVARSQVQDAPEGQRLETDPRRPEHAPHEGHASRSLTLGGGREAGADYARIAFRPAYHDLLDRPAGYPRGAQVNFFHGELRYWRERDDLELHRLTIVDVDSLAPRNAFFRPLSWNAEGGLQRLPTADALHELQGYAQGGAGLTWGLAADDRLLLNAGLQGRLQVSSKLEDDARLVAGPRLRLLWSSQPWSLLAEAEAAGSTDASEPYWRVALSQRLGLSTNVSLRLVAARESDYGRTWNRVDGALRWHF